MKASNRETMLLSRLPLSPRRPRLSCNFLSVSFCDLGRQHLSPDKTVIIGGGFKNGRRAVMVRWSHQEDIFDLESDHEEADTRLLLHAKYAANTYPECRIVLQSPDTDVLALSVTHFSEINCAEFWFKTGVKDHLRYIPVHSASQELGGKMCLALPAFHAVTGCDSTSALCGIGKKKGWKVLSQSETHQDSLGLLGDNGNLDSNIVSRLEAFICDLYPSTKKVPHTSDELRYFLFCQKKQKNELLPPTSDSLLQHLKRVNYQAFVWRQALTAIQHLPEPEANGWARDGTTLKPVYMTKDPAPRSILELTTCSCKGGCKGNCSCKSTGLSCSESCFCMADVDVCKTRMELY